MANNHFRVCLIAASMQILGGHAVQATDLTRNLRQDGISVDFMPINPSLRGVFAACQRIKYMRTVVTSAAYLFHLLRKAGHYDVLHIFSASYLSFMLAPAPAVLIGRLFGKRVVLNYHSGEAEDHLGRSERFVKWILRYVDVVVVPSVYLQRIFKKFGIETTVIHNIIDERRFPLQHRQEFRPRFLVTRNFELMYNIACVLRAFNLIQNQLPDASLTLVGYGSQEQNLKQLAEDLGIQNVKFPGRVEHDVIGEFFINHDFMLNASNIDNMPISLIEAFAAGMPVISTEAGGIPDMITEGVNGFLVPLDDYQGIAEKALRLVREPGLANAVAKNARHIFEENYTWVSVGPKWFRVFGKEKESENPVA